MSNSVNQLGAITSHDMSAMQHTRTESSSTAGSASVPSSRSSASLHLPSASDNDSHNGREGEREHEGLFRAYTQTASRIAGPSLTMRARARASPVRLRFIRGPATGTSQPGGPTSPTTTSASRIPLPRSITAPDRVGRAADTDEQVDGVQMASLPTSVSPSAPVAFSSRAATAAAVLDHPHHAQQYVGGVPASPSASSPQTQPFPPSPSIPRNPTLSSSALPGQGQNGIKVQSPTPPKRHPLRPVLATPNSLNTRSDYQSASSLSASSLSPGSSRSLGYNNRHTQQTSSSVPPISGETSLSSAAALGSAVTTFNEQTAFLSPSVYHELAEEASTPSSAVFTSAFSSPLDSATVPRSFLHQQQQQQQQQQQVYTPSPVNAQDLNQLTDAQLRRHRHTPSDDSAHSRSANFNARQREDTAEQEVLASTNPEDHQSVAEVGIDIIASPGLLSGRSFGNLRRSHSFSSSRSVSSMASNSDASQSASFSSRERSVPPDVAAETEASNGKSGTVGHSESFLDLKNVSGTPKQARNVPSPSALQTTPRAGHATPPSSSANATPSSSSAKASLALKAATSGINATPKLSSSLQRRRDGTFGTVLETERKREDSRGSPASVVSTSSPETSANAIARPPRARREPSDQTPINGEGTGYLPHSGTVGDLSFSGAPTMHTTKKKPAVVGDSTQEAEQGSLSGSNSAEKHMELAKSTSGGLMPLKNSAATSGTTTGSVSGSASLSETSAARSSSAIAATRLLPPSDKIKDGSNRSHARRPDAAHRSSSNSNSTSSKASSAPKEVKAPIVPGVKDVGREGKDGTSWRKADSEQNVPWDVTQPLWYKAPLWGQSPQKGMRAHSATLVPEFLQSPSSSSDYRLFQGYPSSSMGMSTSSRAENGAFSSEMDMFALDPTPRPASLYIFGGCDSKTCFKDLHKLDLQSFHWSKPRTLNNSNAPGPSRAHSTTYIPPFKSLYDGVYDRLAAKSEAASSTSDGHTAKSVRGESMDGHLMFFGGGDGPNYFNDLYLLNLKTMTWNKPTSPPPTSTQTSRLLGSPDRTSTFGPQGPHPSPVTDTSAPSTLAKQYIHGPLPSPRRAHTALWYEKRKELIIFGGGNGSKALNETWVLECKDWKNLIWKKIDALGFLPRVRGYRESCSALVGLMM